MSEDELLALIGRHLPASTAPVPTGDDCTVLAPTGQVAVSTDILVENVHFRTDWSSGADVGWRCVMQNVADAASMRARPMSLVVAMTIPEYGSADWVEDFSIGLREACDYLSQLTGPIAIDGGDMSRGPIIVASGTVLGDMEGREPVLRSGARPGDLVIHTGNLGASARGLELLGQGRTGDETLLFRRPVPPVDLALAVPATAMMDVSDGLVRDSRRIAKKSGVAINLDSQIISEIASPGVTLEQALTGGEDHGFLATVRDGSVPSGWTIIGTVSEGSGVTVDGVSPTELGGWDHFAG